MRRGRKARPVFESWVRTSITDQSSGARLNMQSDTADMLLQCHDRAYSMTKHFRLVAGHTPLIFSRDAISLRSQVIRIDFLITQLYLQ